MDTPITVKRAAERLDVHEETIRRWIKKGELEAIQIGRVFVITKESLAKKEGEDITPTRVLEEAVTK